MEKWGERAMSWAARPSTWGTPGHANRGTEYEAVLDRIELLSSMPRAVKSADQSVTSSTVVVDDTHLQMTLKANIQYDIIGGLFYTGALAGDLKLQWAFSASTGTEIDIAGMGLVEAAGTFSGDMMGLARSTSTSPTATITYGADANGVGLVIMGNIIVGTSDTLLKLQWAQGTSSGTATTVMKGSWVRAFPLFT